MNIKFNSNFKGIPTVVVGDSAYLNNTPAVVSCIISNITTKGFNLTIAQNPNDHSPSFHWIAIY